MFADRLEFKSVRTGEIYGRLVADLFSEICALYKITGNVKFNPFTEEKLLRYFDKNAYSERLKEIVIDVDKANSLLEVARLQLQDSFDNLNKKYIGKSVAF